MLLCRGIPGSFGKKSNPSELSEILFFFFCDAMKKNMKNERKLGGGLHKPFIFQ